MLTAKCRVRDGSKYTAAASDIVIVSGRVAVEYIAAYCRWIGIDPYPGKSEISMGPRRRHKATAENLDLNRPVELVALLVKERTVRCRMLESDRIITLRTGEARRIVPGEIITVHPRKFDF